MKKSCKGMGHNIVPVSAQDVHIKEFECSHCHQKFTPDGYGRMVKLTAFWRQNNELFRNYFAQQRVAS